MRVQLWKIGLAALVTGALFAGCNIFGSNEPVPGDKADELGQVLADFIAGDGTITSSQLLEIAKESRQAADIGVLSLVNQLSQSNTSNQTLTFPFSDMTAARRDSVTTYLHQMDQALSIMFYANWLQNSGNPKPAASALTPDEIEAAKRVIFDAGFDPCGLYTDFVATHLSVLLIDFYNQVDSIGADVSGLTGRYQLLLNGITWNAQRAEAVNTLIDWIGTQTASDILPLLTNPELVGCPDALNGALGDIIDTEEIENYINGTLNQSLRKYYVNYTNSPTTCKGRGDNDGNFGADEERVNGIDDDHDGLIDEDAFITIP